VPWPVREAWPGGSGGKASVGYQGDASGDANLPEESSQGEALPERVQQLNQAIEEVRRQLEALQAQP
jgi:hypothetical protein